MTDVRLLEPATEQRIARTVGRAIRRMRRAGRITQARLGEAVGISQSEVSRIERGRRAGVALSTIARMCDVLDIRLDIVTRLPFHAGRFAETADEEARGSGTVRQRDLVHARASAHVRRRLERLGWVVRQEVEVMLGSSRGFIDILAYHPASGVLMIGEIKTEIRDLGDLLRTLAWYERAAPLITDSFGWRVTGTMGCLFVLFTAANDARIAANAAALAQAFPIRSRGLARWLAEPEPATSAARAMAMVDPRGRRRDWLIGARIDGRRRSAPYRDYRDVADRMSAARSETRSAVA